MERSNYPAAIQSKFNKLFLCGALILAASHFVVAQNQTATVDDMQRRLARARSLAAIGNLDAAARDLETLRTASTDNAVRDVVRVVLMSVYLEQTDYARAGTLLDEAFKMRNAQNENATRAFFALAGQTLNSVRQHLERYRLYGLDITGSDLAAEARTDVDQMRSLLERVVEQARSIRSENPRNMDASALLEDAAGVRTTLARSDADRALWQREVADARQRLAAPDARLSSRAGTSSSSRANASNTASANTQSATPTSNSSSTPTTTQSNSNQAVNTPANESSSTAAAPNPSAQTPSTNATGVSGQLLNVGSLVEKATQRVAPSYPQLARERNLKGVVTVYLVVDERGAVETVQRASGPDLLRRAAEDAARRWRFRPTIVDGRPVRVTGFISFNFTL
ncbi:MAG: TonB family protein [Pyrinomonadaceae bacterium]|nr:TonB family protein [Pyrinomonadaceae bacterium]